MFTTLPSPPSFILQPCVLEYKSAGYGGSGGRLGVARGVSNWHKSSCAAGHDVTSDFFCLHQLHSCSTGTAGTLRRIAERSVLIIFLFL